MLIFVFCIIVFYIAIFVSACSDTFQVSASTKQLLFYLFYVSCKSTVKFGYSIA